MSIGAALHLPAALLGELEAVAVAALLGDDEQRQALVPDAAIGVGAGEQQEHVGAGAEGAPGLHAVDEPAAVGAGGAGGDGGRVGAEVGLGDGDGVQDLGGGELGQPLVLLLLGAAGDERAGEDLGPGDEGAAGAEAAAAQLLGGDDHADVLGLAAAAVAAVLLGDRQAEGAHLGEAADDVLGDVVVVAVDVLGDRLELLVGEAAEGVLHQLEVVVEVAGALLPGERGEERRVAVGGAEGAGAVEGAGLDAPRGLAAEELAGQLADGVGDEGAGDLRLELAVGAVVEHRAGRSRRRRRRGRGRSPAPGPRRARRRALKVRRAGVDDPAGEARRRSAAAVRSAAVMGRRRYRAAPRAHIARQRAGAGAPSSSSGSAAADRSVRPPMTTHDRPFGRHLEDFVPGDVYKHWPGKTITEYDDHLFCMITMNHHPLHTNEWFAENETVQGKNVVVGNLVYSLVLGMSVPDVSGAPSPTSRSSRSCTPSPPSTATRSTPSPRCST